MSKILTGVVAALTLAILGGCGGGSTPAQPTTSPTTPKPTEKPAGEKKPAGGGKAAAEAFPKDKANFSIKGVAKFDGEAKRPEIDVGGDQNCAALHKEKPILKEEIVANGGKLANVVVYVKNADKWTFDAPTTPVTLDQHGCQYLPHVVALQVDQPLVIKNSDALTHNVHAKPQVNQEFNVSQSKAGLEDKKSFSEPEVGIKIQCDVHKWMGAYACVFSHPFFAVTGEDGSFEIKGLPPGEYEVVAWHEKLGEQNGKVTITDKGAEQEFTFKKQ